MPGAENAGTKGPCEELVLWPVLPKSRVGGVAVVVANIRLGSSAEDGGIPPNDNAAPNACAPYMLKGLARDGT